MSHEHFQGGRHLFPMQKSPSHKFYQSPEYPNIEISLVKWPLSVIRLKAPLNAEAELLDLSANILEKWRNYSEGDIVSFTGFQAHNTVTPILYIEDPAAKDRRFVIDIVLRNNRTSQEHPHGIFHPHEQWHHVKKENIGLIEVMGLAVLPGRLKAEIENGALSREDIGGVFVNVLKDCGVFKNNEDGISRFDMFMSVLFRNYSVKTVFL